MPDQRGKSRPWEKQLQMCTERTAAPGPGGLQGGSGEGRRCPHSAQSPASSCPPSGSSEQQGTPLTVWVGVWWGSWGGQRRMGSQDRTRKMPFSPRPPPTRTAPMASELGRGKGWGRGPVFCFRTSWERWESPSTPTCFHFQQSA